MMRRVVITGIGMITPVGTGMDKSWSSLLSGQSGVQEVQSFDPSKFRVKIAGEVKDFDPRTFMSLTQQDRMGRGAQYTYAVTQMAIEDAGLSIGELTSSMVGFYLGSTMGEAQVLENIVKNQVLGRPVPRQEYMHFPSHQMISTVMDEFKLNGPSNFFYNACAAGNYAIGMAADLIRRGKVDIAVSGGVDVISEVAFTGFNRLLSLDPERCRPFDKNRKGLVVSEGAAVLIMEEMEHALKRGANIYAEFSGYGLGMDAHHVTAPHPQGEGALRSIETALANAHLKPEDIDYISAHGTGTPANDKAESYAIKKVFGEQGDLPPVSSIKSMLGHAMGAASAIEAAASCLMITNQVMLPTINFEEPDTNCIQDCVANIPREAEIRHIASNAFAFGGNTACIILSRFQEEVQPS
ncbi:beta-ketoacyl-[acyl-carrier-protein] synthase family protein [Paenibacillus sp. FSL K6-1096]|uniref:beta-ketoacyl-[acyl-carrier-protein] synthase family protein n=1 Tax=Paenibacillus sp. FSL K6-1096 TaxID=2921460 RepID=UPI0030EC381F